MWFEMSEEQLRALPRKECTICNKPMLISEKYQIADMNHERILAVNHFWCNVERIEWEQKHPAIK